ncbi:MAG: nucleoside kinase [Spirochaetales bacterium]
MTSLCSITLPDGSVTEVQRLTKLATLLAPFDNDPKNPIVAAQVNNEVLDLNRSAEISAHVRPVRLRSPEGVRCYRQSLCFLLSLAVHRLDPELRLLIGHSLGNSYYYSFKNTEAEPDLLVRIEEEIDRLVSADEPIGQTMLSYQEAMRYFTEQGLDETVSLLSHRNESRFRAHFCGNFYDISHGPLVPRTGLLAHFALKKLDTGFVLRFPSHKTPHKLAPYQHSPLLYSTYQEYKEWGRILGITSVGRLNQKVVDSQIQGFVQINEALHEKKISDIAKQIVAKEPKPWLVLIAGPSSSGKTTLTKKLSLQLSAQGKRPVLISVDNYFVNREDTPKDEHGDYDFERIQAIDIELFNDHLLRLEQGETVEVPEFDFRSGMRKYSGNYVALPEGGILLVEGIHCLNDELTPRVNSEQKFKVYVSALTQLNLDDRNRISTTDNRLIRRMVRDCQFRGHSAEDTLSMWPSVRRGERKSIFPFQDSADAAFNSALDYELGVLKAHAEPLLRRVKPESENYTEAVRLAAFLSNFTNIADKFVPEYSILREFIGDSGFHY